MEFNSFPSISKEWVMNSSCSTSLHASSICFKREISYWKDCQEILREIDISNKETKTDNQLHRIKLRSQCHDSNCQREDEKNYQTAAWKRQKIKTEEVSVVFFVSVPSGHSDKSVNMLFKRHENTEGIMNDLHKNNSSVFLFMSHQEKTWQNHTRVTLK